MLMDHFSAVSGLSDEPELEKWINSSEENQKVYEKYRKIWQGSSDIARMKKFSPEKAWTIIDRKIISTNRKKRRLNNILYTTAGMAASLLIILGLSLFTDIFSSKAEYIELTTNLGNRSSVILPDGTGVELNAGANLAYRFNKYKKTREVRFNGEGFFEVAESPKPFIVQTPAGLTLKVLGTKFNLKAYSEENTIRTTLIEGKVELNVPGNKSLVLEPGQIASYDHVKKELNFTDGLVDHDLGWMNNKLYMDNMSLRDVCTILERSYDVKIVIRDTELGNKIHYTGVLKEETIYDILYALSVLSEIKYHIDGKNIIINKR